MEACLKYYSTLHQKGKLMKAPEVRCHKDGRQIFVSYNKDYDNNCYVTIYIYKTGVVLIQGANCGGWEHDDTPDIKPIVYEHAEQLTDSSQSDASQVIHQYSPTMSLRRPQFLTSRLLEATNFTTPVSNSTPRTPNKQ